MFFINKKIYLHFSYFLTTQQFHLSHPKYELNNYLNDAFNKKYYKKEKLNRSRGASCDLRDPNTNNNIIEKNEK